MTHQKDIDDPTFVRDLLESQRIVWLVAEWLHDQGNNVWIPATVVRPDPSVSHEFSDLGDIYLTGGLAGDGFVKTDRLVEVKHRPTLSFTKRSDYPYPTVIVDQKSRFDAKPTKPDGYVIVNREKTHAAVVYCKTQAAWSVESIYAKNTKQTADYYVIPRELPRFIDLRERRSA